MIDLNRLGAGKKLIDIVTKQGGLVRQGTGPLRTPQSSQKKENNEK